MFALGEWTVLSHPTRSEQVLLTGPTAPEPFGRLITCAADVRETAEGRRFRVIVGRRASRRQKEAWRKRHIGREAR